MVYNLQDGSAKRVTTFDGTDTQPMWHGAALYYLSDSGDEHRLNLHKYDVATGADTQITHYKDFDIRWPAIGPGADGGGEIVFQNGDGLVLLDLRSLAARNLNITVPGARANLRSRMVDAGDLIAGRSLSGGGARVALEARGDIWTVPAREGSTRNLTRTSGSAERDPAYSPDGKSVAYFSDAPGTYELFVTPADGRPHRARSPMAAMAFLGPR